MLRNVFLKTLRDQRRSLAWWSAGLVLFAAMMVAFYPSVSGNPAIQDYVDNFPKELMALMGIQELTDFTSPAGYLQGELFSIMVPIVFIVFAVGLGAGSIAGEENEGTMEMLLSEPVTRERLVLEKFASLVAATAGLGLVLWLALMAAAPLAGMEISPLRLLEAGISAALLGLAFGAVAFAAGSVTGRRGVSVGVAAGAAAVTYLLNALAGIVDYLGPAKWLSPFFYYNGDPAVLNGLNILHTGVLLGLVLLLGAVSYAGFQRRDLRL
ncbi:MAG: ABC transporter permease subunit [Chloroflexi bacterium]|nr:ABC transporter permease subunit [Chloroflexota bacterium]